MATISETAKGLSIHPEKLVVSAHQPKEWEDILKFITSKQDQFDGILFDWNLSNKNEDGNSANFDIEALSQQIKRNIIEKKGLKKDFPILLCSANYKFSRIFKKELTSHDLFDKIYEKDEFNDHTESVINELISLAKGYKFISKNLTKSAPVKSCESILKLNDSIIVDYRVEEYLKNLIKEGKPVHEVGRFILDKLVKNNGILVDQYLLASRFGVDIINANDEVKEDWQTFLTKIDKLKYKGAFNDFIGKWWMRPIVDWWYKKFKVQLGSLDAKERVEFINDKYNLSLVPASKTEKSKSSLFWVVCEESKRPIAIEDGILLPPDLNTSPWEEDKYLSVDKAIERDSKSIHPLERDRLKKLKKIHARVRRR